MARAEVLGGAAVTTPKKKEGFIKRALGAIEKAQMRKANNFILEYRDRLPAGERELFDSRLKAIRAIKAEKNN